MARQKLLVESVVILGLLLIGSFILMSVFVNPAFAQVEKKDILLDNSLTVQGNDYEYRTINVSSGDFVASFTVSDGKTIKFYPFDLATFSMWQEGTLVPHWVETDYADYGMGITLSGSTTETSYPLYLVFLNDNSYEKEVHLRFFRVWHETNYLGIIGGIAMMAIGAGLGVGLKIKKLHAGYLMCIYVLGLVVMPLFMSIAWNWIPSERYLAILSLASHIQSIILLGALPIGVLVYLWLQKGGGSAFLESWNVGKRLRIVYLLLLSGFLINVALITIDALMLWNFSSIRVEIEHGVTRTPNPVYFGLFGIACAMILSGIVAFTGLLLRKSELPT